jgi:hypothetical protein
MAAAAKSQRIALASGAIAALIGGLLLALWARPPGLLRVGANYAAKIVCSNLYLAGRDPAGVLRDDVQAPGAAAVLRLMRVSVDPAHGLVRAGFLGFIGDGLAAARPDRSCVAVPDGNLAGVPPRLCGPYPRQALRATGPTARACAPIPGSIG